VSGHVLAMPEPPDEGVEELLERLRVARGYRDDAVDLLERLQGILHDPEEESIALERRLHLMVEIDLAERRLIRWGVRIERLETRARAMGLRS
jgi:hypothetical protein